MTASTPSPTLDEARAAFDEGDLARARTLLSRIDVDTLDDDDRDAYDRLDGLLRPDRAAILIAVVLGLGLAAIAIVLFA